MLIERRKPATTRSLSVRVDDEASDAIQSLSQELNESTSVLLRLALHNLLTAQKAIQAQNIKELINASALY